MALFLRQSMLLQPRLFIKYNALLFYSIRITINQQQKQDTVTAVTVTAVTLTPYNCINYQNIILYLKYVILPRTLRLKLFLIIKI